MVQGNVRELQLQRVRLVCKTWTEVLVWLATELRLERFYSFQIVVNGVHDDGPIGDNHQIEWRMPTRSREFEGMAQVRDG